MTPSIRAQILLAAGQIHKAFEIIELIDDQEERLRLIEIFAIDVAKTFCDMLDSGEAKLAEIDRAIAIDKSERAPIYKRHLFVELTARLLTDIKEHKNRDKQLDRIEQMLHFSDSVGEHFTFNEAVKSSDVLSWIFASSEVMQ